MTRRWLNPWTYLTLAILPVALVGIAIRGIGLLIYRTGHFTMMLFVWSAVRAGVDVEAVCRDIEATRRS
jgi:hypothetical protein